MTAFSVFVGEAAPLSRRRRQAASLSPSQELRRGQESAAGVGPTRYTAARGTIMFLLLLSLAFADAAPEPCDGLSEGAACTDYNDAAGTCTSCGTNCLECTANSTDSSSEEKKETEDHGCSVGAAPLGLLLAVLGLMALRMR